MRLTIDRNGDIFATQFDEELRRLPGGEAASMVTDMLISAAALMARQYPGGIEVFATSFGNRIIEAATQIKEGE